MRSSNGLITIVVMTLSYKDLYKSFVLSVLLYVGLYESWTLTAHLKRRIKAFENKFHRRMLGFSHREHKTNDCM